DYYRDYSIKINWEGPRDSSGLPLAQEPGGELFYHPTMLAQKAIGHWSQWLLSKKQDERHWEAFYQITRWFVQFQEPQGSWKIPSMEKRPYLVPYSALSQGQAISILVRAFSITEDWDFM